MDLLLTYDVDTTTPAGRRLRKMADLCEGYGHRVQKSVFEIVCSAADLVTLEHQVAAIIDPACDSVRIYRLPKHGFDHVRTLGVDTGAPHRRAIIL